MTDIANPNTTEPTKNLAPLVSLTHAIYALLALHWFFGITYFVAIIINYIKIDEVKGTWLESHFRWQMRTFWYSLLWYIVGFICTFILIGYVILFVNFLWMIYRIVKGWLDLNDGKEVVSKIETTAS